MKSAIETLRPRAQSIISIKTELDWDRHRKRGQRDREGQGSGMCVHGCVCVCEASHSASPDLLPLFKCWKRQFACSPPAFSARCSIWSNLPFQTHFYLIASSETKWHWGRTPGLECRCNTNTVHLQIENEKRTEKRGKEKKAVLTFLTCSVGDNRSGVSEEVVDHST